LTRRVTSAAELVLYRRMLAYMADSFYLYLDQIIRLVREKIHPLYTEEVPSIQPNPFETTTLVTLLSTPRLYTSKRAVGLDSDLHISNHQPSATQRFQAACTTAISDAIGEGEREISGGPEAAADAGGDGKATRFVITIPTGTPSRTTDPRNLPLSGTYSPPVRVPCWA